MGGLNTNAVILVHRIEPAIETTQIAAIASEAGEVRIGIGVLPGRIHPRQSFRAQFEVQPFRALDFLPGTLDIRVALERGQDGIVEGETRNAHRFPAGHFRAGPRRNRTDKKKDNTEENGKRTHGRKSVTGRRRVKVNRRIRLVHKV